MKREFRFCCEGRRVTVEDVFFQMSMLLQTCRRDKPRKDVKLERKLAGATGPRT